MADKTPAAGDDHGPRGGYSKMGAQLSRYLRNHPKHKAEEEAIVRNLGYRPGEHRRRRAQK